jgi:UDP-N-acetylglucosamine 2-epimerase (hydrolysing)
MGFSDFVHEHRPDLVIIHGDRVEAMAAAIVCAMRYIPSAHIEGGEVSGTIDESIRHCNTKLCSSHFVSSEAAKKRVLALGEQPDRVFVIGSPELDAHARASGVSIEKVRERYDISFDEYGIVIFHPVTSEASSIAAQATSLFDCLIESKRNFVVILPNNDPGSEAILSVISQLPRDTFKVLPSMRFSYFSELLRSASIMIGNSSAGVRECPFLGIQSIDIGTRQHNRALARSVRSCSAFDKTEVLEVLRERWGTRYGSDGQFGNGKSAEAFTRALQSEYFWTASMQKHFSE